MSDSPGHKWSDKIPIRSPRLTLREFMEDDVEAVYSYASDPDVVRSA